MNSSLRPALAGWSYLFLKRGIQASGPHPRPYGHNHTARILDIPQDWGCE